MWVGENGMGWWFGKAYLSDKVTSAQTRRRRKSQPCKYLQEEFLARENKKSRMVGNKVRKV